MGSATADPGTGTFQLRLGGVSKAYGVTQALQDVSLGVERGTVHALLGGNGSGKSTLVRILAGVTTADAGELELPGVRQDLSDHSPSRARAMDLHFVHQQNSTFPDLSVEENLSIGRGFETRTAGWVRWPAVRRRARRVLSEFEIAAAPDDRLGDLKPASQMMVAIARALQDQDEKGSGVLVLDEPTAGLPKHEVDLVLDGLMRYARGGYTIIYVTHRMEEVLQTADAGTVLRDGRAVSSFKRGEVDHDDLVTMIVGQPIEKAVARPRRERPAEEKRQALLTAEGIGADKATLTLRPGEVLGIAGILGSGRTRLLRQLFGAAPSDMVVTIDGERVATGDTRRAMAAGIAYIPEDRPRDAVFPGLSVTENLSIGQLERHSRGAWVRGGSERRSARELCGKFAVRCESEAAPIATLSGGNQQKVVLARWLQRRPRVLLLDEPTQGVDVGARSDTYAMVRRAVDEGAGAILVASDFEELAAASDRVVVLRDGRLSDWLAGDDVTEARLNALVYRSDN